LSVTGVTAVSWASIAAGDTTLTIAKATLIVAARIERYDVKRGLCRDVSMAVSSRGLRDGRFRWLPPNVGAQPELRPA
jgi:hypothetical protein